MYMVFSLFSDRSILYAISSENSCCHRSGIKIRSPKYSKNHLPSPNSDRWFCFSVFGSLQDVPQIGIVQLFHTFLCGIFKLFVSTEQFLAFFGQEGSGARGAAFVAQDQRITQLIFCGVQQIPGGGVRDLHPAAGIPDRLGLPDLEQQSDQLAAGKAWRDIGDHSRKQIRPAPQQVLPEHPGYPGSSGCRRNLPGLPGTDRSHQCLGAVHIRRCRLLKHRIRQRNITSFRPFAQTAAKQYRYSFPWRGSSNDSRQRKAAVISSAGPNSHTHKTHSISSFLIRFRVFFSATIDFAVFLM